MKKLDKLILVGFNRSFIATFFISVFFFLLLFIFVYVDEFIGKGIGAGTFLQLFLFSALNTIPRALPLSLLLASVMSMGRLTENFELAALQSAGVGFSRIMRPLLATGIISTLLLFEFSEHVLPSVNLRAESLLAGIRSARPELLFHEGEFNNRLPGYSIRIGHIDEKNGRFETVMIYDHSRNEGNTTVCIAETGELKNDAGGSPLLILRNGSSYKEIPASGGRPMIRETFEERVFRIPLSSFGLHPVGSDAFANDHSLMSTNEISAFCDSLRLSAKALSVSQSSQDRKTAELDDDLILKYTIEWHKRFRDAGACLLMIILGGPVGFHLRRGGLGMPMVASVIIYILYHVLSMTGEKLAEDGSMNAATGAWFPLMTFAVPAMLIYFIAATGKKAETVFTGKSFRKN